MILSKDRLIKDTLMALTSIPHMNHHSTFVLTCLFYYEEFDV